MHYESAGRNTAITFGVGKKWCGYPIVKKFDDMFSRLDTIGIAVIANSNYWYRQLIADISN